MRILKTAPLLLAVVILAGCESGELGIKIKVEEVDSPAKIPDSLAEEKVGELTVAVTQKNGVGHLKNLADLLSKEGVSGGVLTFTKLSVRNRRMDRPPRASGEIDAICIWQETDEDPVCYKVRVRTFSIEIDDWDTQLKWLQDQALQGMADELADEM